MSLYGMTFTLCLFSHNIHNINYTALYDGMLHNYIDQSAGTI